jgi:hypothetical protein
MQSPELLDMASQFIHEAEQCALVQLANAGFTPSGLERYKLDRLRELRAVIASLRLEGEQAWLSPRMHPGDARVTHAQ